MDNNSTHQSLMQSFSEVYSVVHGPIVCTMIVFGLICNFLCIVTLQQPKLRLNPTYTFLTALAVSQLVLHCSYVFYTVYSSFLDEECVLWTKTLVWRVALLVLVNFNLMFHTIGVYLTACIACYRYFTAKSLRNSVKHESRRSALMTICVVYLVVPAACVPYFFNSVIERWNLTEECGFSPQIETYHLQYRREKPTFLRYNFVSAGIVCKIVPCLIMATLSFGLIHHLKKAYCITKKFSISNTSHHYSHVENACPGNEPRTCSLIKGHNGQLGRKMSESTKRRMNSYRRTTLMLIIVVLSCTVVELPIGALDFMSVLDENIMKSVYHPLGDFLDMLTIFYSSLNFVLYCAMSSEFRETFNSLIPQRKQPPNVDQREIWLEPGVLVVLPNIVPSGYCAERRRTSVARLQSHEGERRRFTSLRGEAAAKLLLGGQLLELDENCFEIADF